MQNTNPNQSIILSSLPSLVCEEKDHETGLLEDSEEDQSILTKPTSCCNGISSVSEYEDDYLQILLQREISFNLIWNSDMSITGNSSRNGIINDILNMRAMLGFRFQTAYLSVSYFDLFLSKRSIDTGNSWAIPLLSVACLSLAAKMEENRLPSLSEFHVGAYNFECKVIQRMELLVLNTLEWKMGVITPFAYLPYFINKFCHGSPPKGTASRIIKLILALMREINLMGHHQYAIASASTLVALDQCLSRKSMELKMNTIMSGKFLDIEDIFTCYNIMLQLEMDHTKVPNLPDSRDLSPVDVFHNSPTTSSLSNKRKRLTFNDRDDHSDDLCKKQRHYN